MGQRGRGGKEQTGVLTAQSYGKNAYSDGCAGGGLVYHSSPHHNKIKTGTYIGRIPTAQKELTETTPTAMGFPIAKRPKDTLEIEMLLAQTERLHCSVCLL